MLRAMSDAAPQRPEIAPVDIQRLLVWYYESVDPGRPHIRSRGWGSRGTASVASARL